MKKNEHLDFIRLHHLHLMQILLIFRYLLMKLAIVNPLNCIQTLLSRNSFT